MLLMRELRFARDFRYYAMMECAASSFEIRVVPLFSARCRLACAPAAQPKIVSAALANVAAPVRALWTDRLRTCSSKSWDMTGRTFEPRQ